MTEYRNYQQLEENEKLGLDYRIRWRDGSSGTAVMAPHGGGIEPGTTAIADAVAGNDHTFYSLEGLKPHGNLALHIKSVEFDERVCKSLAKRSQKVLSIHGCNHKGKAVAVGGLDAVLKERVREGLKSAGFFVREDPRWPGKNPQNICNQGARGVGVQLEIPVWLRSMMFKDFACSTRKNSTEIFNDFVSALREALAGS
jgi:phage replication-related protein YjqB (UPF0714/DUF867 family)